ncbi:hypothetical protein PENTCL1PPCAC_17779, partial [Pristionchus entomophagus]
MTINYNLAVSTSRPWTLFKLLLKWRGSIWKSVIMELSVWLILYATISVVYRCALNPQQQRIFERVVEYLDARLDYIPLNFMLGFFVTIIVNRWTYLYQIIGFIDNIGLMVAEYVRGRSEECRMYRRTILRYCELAQVLVFRDISMRTRRRFPTIDTVVAAGFMMPHEKDRFDEIEYKYSKYWMPFQWALALTYDARKKGIIESDFFQVSVTQEIKQFRTGLAWICNYDWVPIPIMYPQLVCLAVHTYFLVCVLSRQYIISEHAANKTEIDLYFPIMSVLQFIFYMGWMKVAEAMLNPFGEDDDDFETNALIDRNITMGLMIVDQGYNRPPDLGRDPFWGEEVDPLYSEETAKDTREVQMEGSVSQVKLPEGTSHIRMVSKVDSVNGLVNSASTASLRKRMSIVSVKRDETRESGRSIASFNAIKSIKSKIERSLSKTRLDETNKAFSTSNLDKMNEKSPDTFSREDFEDTGTPTNTPATPSTPTKKTMSSANLKGHTFAHHVLENVEEDEESEDDEEKKRRSANTSKSGEYILFHPS